MDDCKAAVQTAVTALEESYKAKPDFRKTQALETLGQALHFLEQDADKIPPGQPVAG